MESVASKSVDQEEAQPCEDGQVELIFNLIRIIKNLTWTICNSGGYAGGMGCIWGHE